MKTPMYVTEVTSLKLVKTSRMFRLNSEDFSKIFLRLDILFLTHLYESTRQDMQKKSSV